MNIAYFCAEFPPRPHGGIGTFVYSIANGMVEIGHHVTVVEFGDRYRERSDGGVSVVTIPQCRTPKISWLVTRLRLYRWLRKQVRSEKLDIVEIPELDGIMPFRFGACPVVVRLHSSGKCLPRHMEYAKKGVKRWLERRTLRSHGNWISVSKYIQTETQQGYKVTPTCSEVIYNPVNIGNNGNGDPPFAPNDYILYAGSVSDRKGAFVLAEAARYILPKYPDLHVLFVGYLTGDKGRRADERIRHIVGQRLAARVHFTGPVAHDVVLSYMRQAKVFAFPSKLEAFGLAPVEAMSCGVPVVYSKLHAGPEVIDDGVTGLLADPHNPDDVAKKVTRILNDHRLSARLAENARKAVEERFSLQRCIDGTLAFYESLLAAHQTSRYPR